MGRSDQDSYSRIWEAALRDAAGYVSAYITPDNYGLDSLSVAAASYAPGSNSFEKEIGGRLDLSRADIFSSAVDSLDRELTSAYRHSLFREQGILRGKIHVPLFITALARGTIVAYRYCGQRSSSTLLRTCSSPRHFVSRLPLQKHGRFEVEQKQRELISYSNDSSEQSPALLGTNFEVSPDPHFRNQSIW